MTVRISMLVFAVLTAMSWRVAPARAAEPRLSGRLRISLNAEFETSERLIRIADVAQIAGGNPFLRERVGQLDLLKLDDDESSAEVSRTLVQARLLLSGAAPDGFRVDGARVTRITAPIVRTPEDRALAAARAAIARRSSLAPDEVIVRLSQPLAAGVAQDIERTPAGELEARLATDPDGGRTRVELWVRDVGGAQRVRQIAIDVRFRQLVPVATRPLKPRQTLTEVDVELVPRDLLQRGVALTIEQVTGKALRRTVARGDVISVNDLIEPLPADEPLLIKPRDIIRVTVRKGPLTVEMPSAQALQAGREGEMIRVRNPSSGRVVIGRVTAAGEVEVPL